MMHAGHPEAGHPSGGRVVIEPCGRTLRSNGAPLRPPSWARCASGQVVLTSLVSRLGADERVSAVLGGPTWLAGSSKENSDTLC